RGDRSPQGVDMSTLRALNFTIMETECTPRPQVPIDDCNFKENGVIKDCSGPVTILQDAPESNLRCRDASSDPVLVQRGRLRRFFGKIRPYLPVILPVGFPRVG
ncbi:cathelicidin antimicrobial peptide, partial [Numida meleagris]|uniref:cathelicidin antimicrobial peptide n=1 Tax=Numida meleagris TaxID=8996 RepID=UPI000B3E2E48